MIHNSRQSSYNATYARWALVLLSLGSLFYLLSLYQSALSLNGLNVFELLAFTLFGLLAFWISVSFWSSTIGLIKTLFYDKTPQRTSLPPTDLERDADLELEDSCKTAILMPIYNESPTAVFSRIKAMIHSLTATGQGASFEFFVLSDTTDPDVWLEEELAWSRLVSELQSPINIYYRRRLKNIQRKAGNIADFCNRWGRNFDFMIVLDADSVMSGETLVEMVRRMVRDPQLGILQVPPRPVNRTSLFARLQQFAASIYGPLCIRGFDAWAWEQGNYWGHNAIIRVRPFMNHCDLPILPGAKPLGGEILSHDFVEAALMANAGWKIQLAYDLDGSYEECPTTLIDFAQRDQRWCQGNMQHAQLIFSEGFRPMSKIHFSMGVMSYVSSPIWLLFIFTSLLGYGIERGSLPEEFVESTLVETAEAAAPMITPAMAQANIITLFTICMSMLLLPKLWSLIALLKTPETVALNGGWRKIISSVFLETAISVLIAPVMAYYHSRFVIMTLRGKSVKWTCQRRDEANVTLHDAWLCHRGIFFTYLAAGALLAWAAPELTPWFVPMLAGPILIFPLAKMLGDQKVGKWLQSQGLLLIPEELEKPQILQDLARALQDFEDRPLTTEGEDLFGSVLAREDFNTLHVSISRATQEEYSAPEEEIVLAEQILEAGSLSSLSPNMRRSLLADTQALTKLRSHYLKLTST